MHYQGGERGRKRSETCKIEDRQKQTLLLADPARHCMGSSVCKPTPYTTLLVDAYPRLLVIATLFLFASQDSAGHDGGIQIHHPV